MQHSRLALLVILLATACATTDEPFMANALPAEREKAIKAKLQAAAEEALREFNVRTTPEVSNELRLLWQIGARQLVEDHATSGDVSRAAANAKRIVVVAANSSGSSVGANELTIAGVERARVSICPVYPFC